MREVARFFDASEAHIALGYLRAQGFQVELADYHTLSARPELRFGGNHFRILAADEDAWLASKALEETTPKSRIPNCPECGSTDTVVAGALKGSGFAEQIVALFTRPTRTKTFACSACQHKWTEDKDEP